MPCLFRIRMAGAAAPHGAARTAVALRALQQRNRRRDWCRCRAGRPHLRRRAPDGMAACRSVDAQGRSRHSRPAAIAPGAGRRIRPAVERAGHLPDGAVAGLGRGLFPGARRPAGHLRQRDRGDVVGDSDPDHRGLWRRGADHPARPHGRGAGDDIRARRVRAVDRHSRDRFCSRDTARQLPENLGVGQQGAVLRQRSAPPRSPT